MKMKTKKKWGFIFLLIALSLTTVFLLTGGKTSEKNEKTTLRLMLDWYPNAVHTFIYVAQEKGYFAEEGLDVVIEMPSDVNDPLRLAAAGKVDLAINYQNQLILSNLTLFIRYGAPFFKSSRISSIFFILERY